MFSKGNDFNHYKKNWNLFNLNFSLSSSINKSDIMYILKIE